METKQIILLILILVLIYMCYRTFYKPENSENFLPYIQDSSYVKNYTKYRQVGPIYKSNFKKSYNECSYGTKRGRVNDISDCVIYKGDKKEDLKKEIKKEMKGQENFKIITENSNCKCCENKEGLSDLEYQFGYYKIFNDLEEVNKKQFNQLNLPVGNYNTKTDKLLGDVNGCDKCVGSPETYYLKYKPEQLKGDNKILASNISDYDALRPLDYVNDNLTGNVIEPPAASGEVNMNVEENN